MKEHLGGCLSCQAIVESLRNTESARTELGDWASESTSLIAALVSLQPDDVRFGQIWLTRDSYQFGTVSYADLDRLFVLVLEDPVEEHDWTWLTYSALDGHRFGYVHRSSPGTEQSTLEVPLATFYRYQTTVMRNQLDSVIGELTGEGREVLQAVERGDFDAARFGAALESAHDLRLSHTGFLAEAIDRSELFTRSSSPKAKK